MCNRRPVHEEIAYARHQSDQMSGERHHFIHTIILSRVSARIAENLELE